MDDAAQDNQALFEAVVFLHHLNHLPYPRQRGKLTYPRDEVLLPALLAVLAGAESFVEIARFGEKKVDSASVQAVSRWNPVARPSR